MPTDFELGQRAPFTAAEQEQVATPDEFNYTKQIEKVRQSLKNWDTETKETDKRRRQRKIEVDIDLLRKDGRIKVDETLHTIRVIDEIIRKEQPSFMNYITGSRRLGIFKNPQVPTDKIGRLEQEFTEGMRYSGWTLPYYGTIDGGQLHGWDSVEVLYDTTKPFKVAIEHVGHEDLVFSRKSLDIQADKFIMRRLHMTSSTLENMVTDFGFDEAQVNILLEDLKSKSALEDENMDVYKMFIKIKKQVFVAYLEPTKCTTWLLAPKPLDLGRRTQVTELIEEQVPTGAVDPLTGQPVTVPMPRPVTTWVPAVETQYPVRIYRYSQTEEKSICEQKGHAFFDIASQEASCALASLYINGCVRASNIFASAQKDKGDGSMPKKLDFTLEHGCVYDAPIDF
jgi:hypothetical protein